MIKRFKKAVLITAILATGASLAQAQTAASDIKLELFADQPSAESQSLAALDITSSGGNLSSIEVPNEASKGRYLRISVTSSNGVQSYLYRVIAAPSTGRVFVITPDKHAIALNTFLTTSGLEVSADKTVKLGTEANFSSDAAVTDAAASTAPDASATPATATPATAAPADLSTSTAAPAATPSDTSATTPATAPTDSSTATPATTAPADSSATATPATTAPADSSTATPSTTAPSDAGTAPATTAPADSSATTPATPSDSSTMTPATATPSTAAPSTTAPSDASTTPATATPSATAPAATAPADTSANAQEKPLTEAVNATLGNVQLTVLPTGATAPQSSTSNFILVPVADATEAKSSLQGNIVTLAYASKSSIEDVSKFYDDQLKAQGFARDDANAANASSADQMISVYKRGDATVTVTINAKDGAYTVTVDLGKLAGN